MSNFNIPDQGCVPKKPKTRPLQFKRGTAEAFRRANPILLNGEPAWEWDTYRLKVGDGNTRYKSLPYIIGGKDGKSAYQLWLEAGFSGTIEDFLDSLIGEPGKSTYEIWLSLGNEGTVVDFINSIKGDTGETGKSAYDIWIDEGNEGTITDFLNDLHGKSAYEIWLGLGNQGTERDFIESLKGEKGDDGRSAYECWLDNGHEGTMDDYENFMTTSSWGTF